MAKNKGKREDVGGSAQIGGGRPRILAKQGFATMDQNRLREIASMGGQAAHRNGTAHEFNSAEARSAGQKGGEAVSRDRDHMADIGRKGGTQRSANRATVAEKSAAIISGSQRVKKE